VEFVLKRLRDEKLFAKLSKCEFNKPSVTFLGDFVSQEGLRMERKKVECALQWPRPTTKLEVQSFLGFANYYRRFIKEFSQIAAPISNITRAKNAYLWSEKHDEAFASLKPAFTTAPVLKIPDPTKPHVVKADASTSRFGALLEQEEEDGWHPFTSRKLQPAEENYPVHDIELRAIVYALKEWRVYLHGVAFEIETDHHPLRYLDIQPQLSKRQLRWLEDLAEFNFKIRYMKGKYNQAIDALSRMYDSTSTKLYEDDRSSKTAAEHANVKFLSVNVLNVGDVHVDKSVIEELQRDYVMDETHKEVYAEPGEQFVKTQGLLYDEKGNVCIPDGRLLSVRMPYVVGPSGTRFQLPPEPVIIEGFEEYVVEKVLAERKNRNKLQCLVKWKHYPLSDASWEPLHDVAGNEALFAFQMSRQEPSASERGAV
jgi:RNase H-like domain found in reverse transcriptase/Chromo (CHRromatin Organisation MOdifier) domain